MADDEEERVLRVSNTSNPTSLASAIAYGIYDSKTVVLRAIGAGAVNQAVKAIAIARGYVAQRAVDLHCYPGFTTVDGDRGEISAIKFKVFSA